MHGNLPAGSPPQSWSQIVEQTPGYGVTASSGGMTTPSTTAAGMSGYVAPPPGLPPIDFSSWRLPPPEALASGGLPSAPSSLPGVRRSLMLRGVAERNAIAQTMQCPGSLAQWAQTQSTSMLCAPKQCCLSANHYQGDWQCCTSRRYNCQRSPQGGKLLPTPQQIKLPPGVVQVHRTKEDLPLEGGEMVANPSVTPEVRRGR